MMKKLIALIFLSIFYSCGLDYDGGERIEFKGKILDENGNSLAGINVKAVAERDFNGTYGWTDSDVISYDFTDEYGNFKLYFPSPTNETELELLVNYGDADSVENPNLSTFLIYNIQDENLNNYQLDFGNIKLFEPAENLVKLEIQHPVNYDYELLGWNISGNIVDNYLNFNPFNYSDEFHFHWWDFIWAQPNQTIELTYFYRMGFDEEILQNTVPIEIQNQDLTYEITF